MGIQCGTYSGLDIVKGNRDHSRNCCETCRGENCGSDPGWFSGAGGITYGVVRNIDKLPFVHQQEEETQEKETAETQKEKTTEAEETPKVTQAVPRTVKATGKKEEKSSEKRRKSFQRKNSTGHFMTDM